MKSKCLEGSCEKRKECAIAQGLIKGKQVIKGIINGKCEQYIPIRKVEK